MTDHSDAAVSDVFLARRAGEMRMEATNSGADVPMSRGVSLRINATLTSIFGFPRLASRS